MANKDEYLTSYREFFEYFAQTVNPNDQLPVKLGSYKLLNVEVIGGIIDWTTQYLSQKNCPPHLFSPLIKIIIEEIRKACKKHPLTYGFSPTDNAYEPLKLMQAVMAKTNEVCLRYLDNSMLCSLPAPSNTYYKTSIYAMRNRRRKMEDRHVAIHDLNTMFNIQEASPSSYYAIYDGHAGHDAAAYSAAHLHQFLAENKYFISNPEQALLDAFCKTDALFLEKCKIENLSGGTTAVVALLRPKEKTLYIAWVGDSQALLVNQGKVLQCVNPHKPSREDERERIEKTGGCVMLWGTWRVNGQLAVSRAIGDADYKPHVIAIPDLREISLDGGEDFLIIACDGLWDFVSEDAAAQEVYYMIAENPDDTERVGKHLVQLSRYQGSTDNISVIVVFLREPHQIAAEAHRWATRNCPTLTTSNMEAGLDNANNPFNNSNGSLKNLDVDTDNINLQKSSEGLLLNLTDNFKTNGTDLSQDIFVTEKSNGTKKSASDIHFDDDFGPETDVDAVDDAFFPVEKEKDFSEDFSKDMSDECIPKPLSNDVKTLAEGLVNNNPLADAFNPFQTSQKEDRVEEFKELDFNQFQAVSREETPTPPADAVHDVGGLDVNPGESDSEDEWNYIKGDQAKPENLSSQPETVVETSEQDEMSQLNPNAAEFVPVSPTRSNPSPVCRALINDQVISQSPKRPERVDIKVPSEVEFESEVKSRPSDFDNKNGHDSDSDHNTSEADQIENILNGKNIDEIPEFHPGSTPTKLPAEEFHFGPNAAPFTPRSLDQSEAFSTKANFGDDTKQTLNTSFNDSELTVPNKEQTDPMSMSFYAEKGESNPFQDDEDLNKVHELPENLDAFLEGSNSDKENSKLDGTLSDLPEHHPLGIPLDNDEAAIQTTDLDKISQDDEKELASPLEDHDDLLDANPNTSVPSNNLPDYIPFKISDPTLFDDFVFVNGKPPSDDSNIASLPELEPISAPASETEPEALSPQPALISSTLQGEEVSTSPDPLDTSTPILDGEVASLIQSQHQSENAGLVNTEEVATDNLLGTNETEPLRHHEGRLESQNPACEFRPESKSPEINFGEIQLPVCEMKQGIESTELEFNPKSEVENINFESKESSVIGDLAASPELACEYSHVPEYCDSTSQNVLMAESQSPIDLLQEQKQQEEEITSSIKDDVSSPIEQLSPIKSPESLIEEPVKPENLPLEIIETAEIHEDISKREAVLEKASNQDLLSDLSCSLPESQASIQQETKENDMLEMLTAVEPSQTSLSNGFNNLAAEINEQICIKTDSIKPEFAEPAVITPSEESKTIDEIVASSPVSSQTEAPVEKQQEEGIPGESEPLIPQAETLTAQIEEPKPVEVPIETPKEMPVLAPLPIVPATPQEVKEVKSEEKKSSIAGSGKKPIGKVEPRKSTSSQKVGAAKPSPRPATSPKTGVAPKVPSKIGTPKPTGIASKTTSAAAPKTLLKPKTTSAKPIEKKPTVNADVKPLPRTLTKKPTTETTATKTISRPATTAAKTSPTKTTAPRPATAPRTLAPKTSTIPPKPTAAPKPRVPLTSRTTTTTASSKLTTTASARTSATTTTRTMSATKTTPAAPKPRTLTSAAPKPRVPLTKTVTKSADVEKEKKESANKLTASRTTTVTKTTSGTASSRTTTTTVRKSAEIKPLSDRTVASKTTITASKTTTLSKKPGDIKTTAKTKTTKIEKPKQNGVAPTNVTEEIKEITIVNNVVNETESENLLKDNSPLDNKLLIETSNALIDMNPAD